jgi:predicted transcriptional regulator
MRSPSLARDAADAMPHRLTPDQRRAYEALRVLVVELVDEYELPQRVLAEACEVTQQAVSHVLKGKTTAVETLLRLAFAILSGLTSPDRLKLRASMTLAREAMRNHDRPRAK